MGKYTSAFLSYLIHRPWIISFLLFLSLFLWVMSGPSQAEESSGIKETSTFSIPLANVVIEQFESTPTHKTISLYGRTSPDKQAILGAQVAAQIEELLVKKEQESQKGNQLLV